jgi:Flp pilus assembly pilin Flp
MKKRRHQSGQALIEYAFLLVLLAAVAFAVIAMAGNQLAGTYNDVSFEFTHLTDGNTYAPDGSIVPPGTTPSCPSGAPPALRGHKWKCN